MTNTATRNIHDLITTGAVKEPSKRLGKAEKEHLADMGTSFTVNSIQYGEDPKNGPYWSVNATVEDDEVQFNIGSHARRDPFMQSLSIVLVDGPVDGLRLKAYPGQQGNSFINLEPAETE